MKPIAYMILFSLLVFTGQCTGQGVRESASQVMILEGSTPGGEVLKSVFSIPVERKVEFIRWELTLNNSKPGRNTFLLKIVFGIGKPNTLGFIDGGEKRSFEGEYGVSKKRNENINGEIYRLKSGGLAKGLSMVKVNENLFHLLTPENRLMVGDGGWSYTLNRKEPVNGTFDLPALTNFSKLPADNSPRLTYEGRTPCAELARENNWSVEPGCFKLKWLLLLNRDPHSLLPTTYRFRRVLNNKEGYITGKWTIIKGISSNPDAVIYQLDPDKPEKSIFLYVGDENVLFFLNRHKQFYVGNKDFSYTLNKRAI